MKKLLILFVAILAFGVAQSQVLPMVNPNGLALDTASQAAPEGARVKAPSAKVIGIVVVTTKLTGTIAGTVSWQGSNDGVNYSTISTTTLVDASTNYNYKETDKAFAYYKALITQTGTSTLSYKATINTKP